MSRYLSACATVLGTIGLELTAQHMSVDETAVLCRIIAGSHLAILGSTALKLDGTLLGLCMHRIYLQLAVVVRGLCSQKNRQQAGASHL